MTSTRTIRDDFKIVTHTIQRGVIVKDRRECPSCHGIDWRGRPYTITEGWQFQYQVVVVRDDVETDSFLVCSKRCAKTLGGFVRWQDAF